MEGMLSSSQSHDLGDRAGAGCFVFVGLAQFALQEFELELGDFGRVGVQLPLQLLKRSRDLGKFLFNDLPVTGHWLAQRAIHGLVLANSYAFSPCAYLTDDHVSARLDGNIFPPWALSSSGHV